MKVRAYIPAFWAILITLTALTGCQELCAVEYAIDVKATAGPLVNDPEQPQRPSDEAGVVVAVSYDSIAIRQGGQTLSFALDGSTRIRQAERAEFSNLQPYEVVQGLYAVVWLDRNGNAEYVLVTVRKRGE